MKTLGDKCEICQRAATKGFHFHHVTYHPEESDYPKNANSQWTRVQRLEEAEQHPERFALLCGHCHWQLTSVQHFINQQPKAFAKFIKLPESNSL